MTVTKINGFRAPYRSTTFQEQADTLTQANGLIKMTGVVYESGSDVMVPPYTFIQNGLIVESDVEKVVAKPSMEAPYYLTVSAPTSNPVDDLSYQFAKTPTDISSNEVVVAAYDGQEWRMFPFLSLKGIYNQIKQDRIDFGSVGPIDGLYTTENGSDYETSGGTLIDPTGDVKVLTESRLFPQVGDDPDWGRLDRIVYRRPLDAEKRIGERVFCLGGTYSTSPTSLYETASHDDSLAREKIKTVIGSDNAAHMFVASGYGDNWQIIYSKQSSDRQVELVAPVAVAVASSKHFDVVIDNNDEIHLLYLSEGDVYWKKLDDTGADVAGPTQIDTQPNDCTYLALATDPHYSKLYAVWSSLISTDENNLFFKTLNFNGNTITEAKQITTGSTNHIRPHLHVTEDLWVYLVWEGVVTSSIWYTILDDIGEEIKPQVSVSGATDRIGVGTLVDQASHPKIAVSDNKSVFITFLQDKGGATYGISVWNDESAFMQELVDPSESFVHYGFYLDSTFNGLHFILSRSGNIDYVKLEGSEVVFNIPLQAAGASGTHIIMDKFGSMFHSWTSSLAGTFTDYDTGLTFTHTGPQVVVGALNNITLQNTDMLLLATSPSQEPKKGERVAVSGSTGGTNDGTYYIDSVELVSLDAADDYYQISMTTAFPVLETGTPTADLGAPNGNEAYFEKSTSETSDRAFRKTTLPSDVLLARIVRPGPGILNYYNVSPSMGPDFIIPHGAEVSIDWSLTAVDNLTISSDLNLYDMFNVANYVVANGSYPMNEGDALYVLLDPTLPTITPQVTPLNSLPFTDNMRVLGAIINGYFNPFLLSLGGVGILDPNEQVILGEDVPQELRSKIGFVSETEIELYPYTKGTDQLDTYPQFMGETNLIAGQNTHVKLIKGQVSWVKPNADELVFLSAAFLQIPELAESRNRIAPQAIVLDSDGKVAWVNLNRETGASDDLTVNVSAIADLELDGSSARNVFIIARRTGNDVIINCSRLLPGSSKDLDSDLTFENKTLIGPGVTESTSAPTWSTRGAPQRTINDSETILPAIVSMDVEIDKFFGQLRITAHESDADKVRVSGVDLVMKDGSVLSQEISSLLMKFEGAIIDFTTGDVFESDGVTPLGLSFTPTVLADTEVCWYSIAIVSAGTDASNAMGVQFLVLPGAAAADEASATFPPFGGQKKVGMVLVTNDGGSIEHTKIRQLGVGSGSGGGGGTVGKLIEGGVWSMGAADRKLTWSADAYVSLPGITNARNTILADNVTLNNGQAAYVLLNKLAGVAANLTPQVGNIENIFQYDPNLFIFARGVSDGIVIGNSFKLIPSESKELDAGLSIQNRSLLGSEVTEATSDPGYSGRGAPLRTIADSEKMLEAMASMDVEIDKFFGQLRVTPHETDVDKVRVTGVDLTMKDGSVLSQEISDLIMSFEGAVIDFSTGEIFEDDETTPLGVDFTPTPLADTEYAWYSLSLNSNTKDVTDRMTVKLSVVPGTAASDEATAVLPRYSGQKKMGHALIYNDGGQITLSKIRQLGPNGEQQTSDLITSAKLVEGGVWSLSIDGGPNPDELTLAWSADAYVSLPGRTRARNTIQAGDVVLNPGQAAYVVLNPLAGATDNLTPVVADIDAIDKNLPYLFIFARAFSAHVVVGNSFRLIHSESKELDAGLSIQNRALLGPGVTESTSAPTWSTRGAPQRTINDSETVLPAIVSMDVEIDKFFGQLRIIPDLVDLHKATLTGVDLTMKDGSVLSQEISNLVMQFDGAVIDFSTGDIDTVGNDFTPAAIAVGEYCWYSISLVSNSQQADGRMTVNLSVVSGDSGTEGASTIPAFAGQAKIAQIQMFNDAGTLKIHKVRQLGVGSGSGGGGVSNAKLIEGGDWSLDSTNGPIQTEHTSMSPALNNRVRAIHSIGTDIYVGGDFTTAGGISANRIAKYDTLTDTWSALGSGVNGTVRTIHSIGTDLYVAGGFSQAGGISVNNIAKYNTLTDTWSALGIGLNSTVYAVHSIGTDLYAAGFFTTAGGITVNRIAKYNILTETWYTLGTSPNDGVNNTVYALHSIGTDLYVGGDFTTAGGSSANYIAKYNTLTETWSALGSGVSGAVYAIHSTGTDLYVGGTFNTAGGLSAKRIAKWDTVGETWSALGNGIAGTVYALQSIGTDLYVGGSFGTAGGISAIRIAKYDTLTDTWSALGGGADADVNTLHLAGDGLFIGGSFDTYDGESEDRIVYYAFTTILELSWSDDAYVSLPGLINGRNTISADSLEMVSGQAAYVILNPLPGVDDNLTPQVDDIDSISPYTPNLFIFARGVSDGVVVGNNSFKLIDGEIKELDAGLSIQNRSLLGSGVTEATEDPDYSGRGAPLRTITDSEKMLDAMASMDVEIDKFFGQLRITAHETDADKIRVTGVDLTMKDGSVLSQEISSLLMKFEGAIIDFTLGKVFESDGVTDLGLDFTPTTLATTEVCWYSIACISSSTDVNNAMGVQFLLLPGAAAADEASAVFPSFGGQKKIGMVLVENNTGNIEVQKIRQLGVGSGSGGGGVSNAKLIEGGDWFLDSFELIQTEHTSMSPALNGTVRAIASIGTDIYVGGDFTTAGGFSANRIAKYDTLTETWSALGSGVNNTVYAIHSIGTDLYVGGQFITAGGVTAICIAKYNTLTETWSALGSGTSNSVRALHSIGTDLYVGGQFTTAGGIAVNNIAKYDTVGETWSTLGTSPNDGVNNHVYTLHSIGTDLYVGGQFTTAGGSSANYIAKYNTLTETWSALGSGTSNSVRALHSIGTDIYVGGDFTTAGGNPVNRIAKWDTVGETWSALGSGVGVLVTAIASVGTDLYVGGTFTTAGGNSANRIAKWDTVGEIWSALGSGADDTVRALHLAGNGLFIGGSFDTYDGESENRIVYYALATISELSWSEDAYVSLPGLTNGRNTISADTLEMVSGQAAYVNINPLPGAADNLTPKVDSIDAISSFDISVFIFARYVGDYIYIGDAGNLLTVGKTKKLDAAGSADKQDKNLKLIGGGDWSFIADTLSWSADAFIQVDGLPSDRNNIPSGAIAISDGEVAYVNINRIAGDADDLTVVASTMTNIAATNLDAFVIARRVGDNLYLGAGGNRMGPGEIIQLDKPTGGDPSFKVKGTSFPTLNISGGFLRTDDGLVLSTGSGDNRDDAGANISIDLDAIFTGTPTNDTTYYLYVDREKLSDPIVLTDSGESIYTVEEGQYTISDKGPSEVSPYRLIHVQTLRYGTGVWSGAWDAPRFLPDSVGGFFDTVQHDEVIISSATSAQYPHTLEGKPNVLSLEYFDGTQRWPLELSSHVIDITESYIEVDTSTLTFGSGEKVTVSVYFYPSTQIASISSQFTSPWYDSTSVTQFAHNLVDAQDIKDYSVQEWDLSAGRIKNISGGSLVTGFDDTNIYLDWAGLTPSATLKYRVVGGMACPVTSVPVRYGGYSTFVGMGPGSYATLAAAIAASAPGDSILVARGESISSPIDISVDDIKVEFMPNAVIKVIGGTSDGIIVSGSRVDLLGLKLEGDQNATMTNLLRVSGDDNHISRTRIHINDSGLTITNAVNFEGDRNYTTASVRTTAGTLVNAVADSGIDNDYSVRG